MQTRATIRKFAAFLYFTWGPVTWAGADLELQYALSPSGSTPPGSEITFDFVVTNHGPDPISGYGVIIRLDDAASSLEAAADNVTAGVTGSG